MLGWLLNLLGFNVFLLNEEESKQANEAKERTLNILNDALKKKDSLLVDNPEELGDEKNLRLFPLISTDLVKELISQLQKVTFKRNKDPNKEINTFAYVYPNSEPGTIYLCKKFWEKPEFLAGNSRPQTLIHEVSHLLGYGHTIEKNKEKVKNSPQSKLCPVSVHSIERAFSVHMNHRESYTNGSYSCCRETSRDTVCEKSQMSSELKYLYYKKTTLLNEEEGQSANEAKKRTLNILNDALKKKGSLLVDDPEEFVDINHLKSFPLINTDLVKELISQLQKVTFKRNKDPNEETNTFAYLYPTSEPGTIYLCKMFWEQTEFLVKNSRPQTLIHEVSLLLGYGHTIEKNKEHVKTSPQYKLCPVSVHSIERAFSVHMNHRESYTNGSYSCCGETSRDTLCEKSKTGSKLKYLYKKKASLLNEEERKLAKKAKKQALSILNDALKKKDELLVDNPSEYSDQVKLRHFPLISTYLVKELISQLQQATFEKNKDPKKEKYIAYVYPSHGSRTIYLCKKFWEQPESLAKKSCPETLILEVSHFLGYGHTIEENKEKVKTSPQYKLCPLSVCCIEKAFSSLMDHRESYTNGSYSCCGETSRYTVCEKSVMADELRSIRDFNNALRAILRHRKKHVYCREDSSDLAEDTWLFSVMEDFFKIKSITTHRVCCAKH